MKGGGVFSRTPSPAFCLAPPCRFCLASLLFRSGLWDGGTFFETDICLCWVVGGFWGGGGGRGKRRKGMGLEGGKGEGRGEGYGLGLVSLSCWIAVERSVL